MAAWKHCRNFYNSLSSSFYLFSALQSDFWKFFVTKSSPDRSAYRNDDKKGDKESHGHGAKKDDSNKITVFILDEKEKSLKVKSFSLKGKLIIGKTKEKLSFKKTEDLDAFYVKVEADKLKKFKLFLTFKAGSDTHNVNFEIKPNADHHSKKEKGHGEHKH